MTWSEVTKINSNLKLPLNRLRLINQIDLVGSSFIGSSDTNLIIELLAYDDLYSHKIASSVIGDIVASNATIRTAAIANEKAIKNCLRSSIISPKISALADVITYIDAKLGGASGVGEFLAYIAKSENATLKALTTITDVANSSTARSILATSKMSIYLNMNATTPNSTLLTSSELLPVIAADSLLMKKVASKQSLMDMMIDSNSAITAIEASSVAIAALAGSPLRQNVTYDCNTSWTLRRAGKVYIIDHSQSGRNSSANSEGVGYYISNADYSSWLTNATYGITVPVSKFMNGIYNYNSALSYTAKWYYGIIAHS